MAAPVLQAAPTSAFQSLLSQGISLLLDTWFMPKMSLMFLSFNPFLVRASVYWIFSTETLAMQWYKVSIPS